MCAFLIRKMETLIFTLLETTFSKRTFDEKQQLSNEESAMKNLANVCTQWNKSSYTQIFLLLSLMRYYGPQVLFHAIWNNGF